MKGARRLGVRARAGAAAGVGLALGGAILAAALWFVFREGLLRSARTAIEAEAVRIADSADEGLDVRDDAVGGRVVYAAILDAGGAATEAEGRAPDGLLTSPGVREAFAGRTSSWIEPGRYAAACVRVEEDDEDRVAGRPAPAAVVVAVSTAGIDGAAHRLALFLAVLVPAAAVAAGLGGAWLAGGALRSVDEMRRVAAAVGERDLSARVEVPPTEDEVARLAETLNAMLGRIEEAFARNTRFVADASHEIRNPLTNLSTEVQSVLRRDRPADEYRAALESVREEVRRLSDLADGLLFLARADAGRGLGLDEVADLGAAAAEAAKVLSAEAAAKGLTFRLNVTGGVRVRGDVAALGRLARNLVENAVRYAPEGGRVEVRVSAEGGEAALAVEDSGPGIPEEEVPHVFERFWRGEAARARAPQGAGLGLSIASEVAAAHGGRIEVGRSDLGGARIRAFFPVFIPSSSGAA